MEDQVSQHRTRVARKPVREVLGGQIIREPPFRYSVVESDRRGCATRRRDTLPKACPRQRSASDLAQFLEQLELRRGTREFR